MLKEAGLTKIGIMATDGTIQSRIFKNEIEKNGMHGLVPDKKYQRIVMDIIYKDIKAGKIPDIEEYNVVATHLKNKELGNYLDVQNFVAEKTISIN